MCNIFFFKYSTVYFDVDLVSKEIVEKWIKYLRNEFPTVAFKASTQQQTKNLVSSDAFKSPERKIKLFCINAFKVHLTSLTYILLCVLQ